MAETKTYAGSCHCGKVRYEVTIALDGVMACNCSMCGRTGTLLAFVGKDQFKLLSGADAMTDYQFGHKVIHHTFCATCGVRACGHGIGPDGKEMVAVNVRCLEGVDATALPVRHFDGKSL